MSFTAGTENFATGAAVTIASWTLAAGTSNVNTNLTYAGSFNQTGGTVNVAAGNILSLTGSASLGSNISGAGTISISGANVSWTGTALAIAHATVTAGTLTVSGVITNASSMGLTTGHMLIAATGATFIGTGQIILSDKSTNKIQGATATSTLVNFDNTISGAGSLGGGKLTLINRTAGVINGSGTNALIISTGTATITNSGTIEASGSGGVTIQSAVLNTGSLVANGGVLTVTANVTGAGTAVINSGALAFQAAFNENVNFTGSTGRLVLSQSQNYKGAISGLSTAGTNSLDLTDIGFTSTHEATFSGTKTGGVLTVTDGKNTAQINLTGNYTSSKFICSSDGHGGVIVVDPVSGRGGGSDIAAIMRSAGAISVTAARQSLFTSAMASLVAPACAIQSPDPKWSQSHLNTISTPRFAAG